MTEKRFSFSFIFLAVLIITVLFLGSMFLFTGFLDKDQCLDEGGCWDEVSSVCRKHETNAQELCLRKKD